ncbi:MAG: DUF424 family protein [Candidatus Micrarchaeota archaeon]
MYAKVHERTIMESGRPVVRRIVAACDADLLGRVFSEAGMILDLKKYRSFYEGDKVTAGELAVLLEGAKNVNLVGRKTIAAASDCMKITPAGLKKIRGVPHLQIYFV